MLPCAFGPQVTVSPKDSVAAPAAAAQLPDERVCFSEAAAGIQACDHTPRRLGDSSLRRCIPDAAVVAAATDARTCSRRTPSGGCILLLLLLRQLLNRKQQGKQRL